MIGPQDHGRRMTLADYEFIKTKEGHRYELNRGVVEVSKVPDPLHGCSIDQFYTVVALYRHKHPEVWMCCCAPSHCKILIWDFESERHPDVSIYLTPPPSNDAFTWRIWYPAIVVDVVSPYSDRRDQPEKREEFLAVGIKEYWILNLYTQEISVLINDGNHWRERILKSGDNYETRLLPGFQLKVADLLA